MSKYDYPIPSAEELREKHGNWGEHEEFTVWDWTQEVAQRSTRRGYWEWVSSKIEQAVDEERHREWREKQAAATG